MNNSSKFLLLKQIELLSSLTEKQLDLLANKAIYQRVKKDVILYEKGDKSRFVYLVDKGSIKLGITASCGKILIKDIVYDHSIFGENIFTERNARQAFAKTMTDSSVFKIPIEDFKNIVAENGVFAGSITSIIISRLQLLEQRMQNFVFKKAKSRITDFIRKTGEQRGIKIGIDECLINHGMSHKEIAYLTDTSRQTVARVLGELKKSNLIHFSPRKPSKILIRNLLALS